MLASYGALSGYAFGLLVNLSFWPFSLDPAQLHRLRRRACPFVDQVHRYLVYDATTSLGWDTGRAVTTFVCILLAGPAVLDGLAASGPPRCVRGTSSHDRGSRIRARMIGRGKM